MQYLIEGINPVPWTPSRFAKMGKRVQVYKPEELKSYQQSIKDALEDAPRCDAEEIHLQFYFWRTAGTKHDHRADATNLQKALEDALQGVLFHNDRNVVHVETWVMEQTAETLPRIVIRADGSSTARWRPVVDDQPGQFVTRMDFNVEAPFDPDLNVEDFF